MSEEFIGLAQRSVHFELDEQHEAFEVYSGNGIIAIKHAELEGNIRIVAMGNVMVDRSHEHLGVGEFGRLRRSVLVYVFLRCAHSRNGAAVQTWILPGHVRRSS